MNMLHPSGPNVVDSGVLFKKILGLDGVTLRDRQGVTVDISASGGQILSFKDRNGRDVLRSFKPEYLKPNGKNRDGSPVMGNWIGNHPDKAYEDYTHGLFRRSTAEIAIAPGSGLDTPAVVLTTWPHELAEKLGYGGVSLHKKVGILNGGLAIIDEVYNGGKEDVRVNFGLHPYFAVSDIGNVEIIGLRGWQVKDRESGEIITPEFGGSFKFSKDDPALLTNYLFMPPENAANLDSKVIIIDLADPDRGILVSSTHGQRILFNQGPKVFDDVENPRGYVCLEPVDLSAPGTLVPAGKRIVRHTNIDVINLSQNIAQLV